MILINKNGVTVSVQSPEQQGVWWDYAYLGTEQRELRWFLAKINSFSGAKINLTKTAIAIVLCECVCVCVRAYVYTHTHTQYIIIVRGHKTVAKVTLFTR